MSESSRRRILAILGMLLAAAALIAGAMLFRNKNKETGQSRTDFAMGSAVSVKLYGSDVKRLVDQALEEVRELDEEVISWRVEQSELSALNKDGKAGEAVSVSSCLGSALEQALRISKRSDGALDITLRPVLTLWGIEDGTAETFRVPSEEELRKAAEHTGWKSVVVTPAGGNDTAAGADKAGDDGSRTGSDSTEIAYSVTRTDDQTILDLGSVGKGYALDVVYDALKPEIGKTLDGGVIAVGGSILVFGKREDGSGASEGKGFRVGIRDPEGQPEDVLGVITFPENTEKCCISTSGGYEKYVEKDGVRYHHIIDPATLHPADSGLASVTVVCENGLVSDGLSTACFILGEEKAKQLLSEYGAEGILIREDGSRYITPGLEGRVEWK